MAFALLDTCVACGNNGNAFTSMCTFCYAARIDAKNPDIFARVRKDAKHFCILSVCLLCMRNDIAGFHQVHVCSDCNFSPIVPTSSPPTDSDFSCYKCLRTDVDTSATKVCITCCEDITHPHNQTAHCLEKKHTVKRLIGCALCPDNDRNPYKFTIGYDGLRLCATCLKNSSEP